MSPEGLNYIKSLQCFESVFQNKYPDDYNEIYEYTSFLPNDYKFVERRYYYINQLKDIIKCPYCNKPLRIKSIKSIPSTCGSKECYSKNISSKIKYRNETTDAKSKISNSIKKNWDEGKFNKELRDIKSKQTKLERYGNSNYNNIEKLKETYKNKSDFEKQNKIKKMLSHRDEKTINSKRMQTMLNRYGASSFAKTDKYKELFNNQYYVNNIQNKIYLTKKQNNSFNISKQEDEVYNLLLSKFNNVLRQYKSMEYPYNCDFYIPDLDLYIEYNGNWTHGGMPYNKDNPNCIDLLNKWKLKSKELNCNNKNKSFYNNAIYTWTILDVNKRKIAYDNNLNWLEFFNIRQFNDWFNTI